MQIRNSKLCDAIECIVYSAVNHPWWTLTGFAEAWLGCSLHMLMLSMSVLRFLHLIAFEFALHVHV